MTALSTRTALVRGRVVRFTLVDACGMPQITNSVYVTDGFITAKTTKNVDTGDEIKVRRANGTIGIRAAGRKTLTNIDIEVNLDKIDPGAIAMLTGDPLVLDYASTAVGWEERGEIPITQTFAMEVWTATQDAACAGGVQLSGYMLYPLIEQAHVVIDDITDKEITATVMGSSLGSPSWGKGPYGSASDGSSIRGPVATAVGVPGRLLAPVDPATHRHFEVTTIAPPAAFVTPGPISMTLPTTY